MISLNFTYKTNDKDSIDIYVNKWLPEKNIKPKAILQIIHGMAEHSQRYERFASQLTKRGFIVYADDHRGHGKTSKSIDNLGFIGLKNSFLQLVEDQYQLTKIIKKEHTNLPLFIFGHSMGSFISRIYITKYGNEINGVILSGTGQSNIILLYTGKFLSYLEMLIKGPFHKSKFMNNLSFGSYNKKFKPAETEFDWLSRDKDEVKKYIDDPYCGTIFPSSFFYNLTSGLIYLNNKKIIKNIPENLPVLFISGDRDPVGNNGKSVQKLFELYKKNKIIDVSIKLYQNARHELLNEINRDEVTLDVINWLESKI